MKKIGIILVLLSILSIGCYKNAHCPRFPTDLNYFPYYELQELKFTNSQQNSHTFTIAQIEKSKDYICKQTDKCRCECNCGAYSEFRTNYNSDMLDIYANFWIYGEGEKNVYKVHMIFRFVNDYFEKTLFEGNTVSRKDIGKYLEDTIVIENADNQIVKKIVIAKGKGLVSYTTADGEEWKLVE